MPFLFCRLFFITYPLRIEKTLKLEVLEGGLENHLEIFYLYLKKIKNSLPAVLDLQTQQWHEAILANADYPWGDPSSLKDKPGKSYTRVSEDPKLAAVLSSKHGKSFENVWKDIRGVIWGNVIRKEDGSIYKMNYLEAVDYCKSIEANLPMLKEWKDLRQDMLAVHGFVPQYLRICIEMIFGLHGSNGNLFRISRLGKEAVRCVVRP